MTPADNDHIKRLRAKIADHWEQISLLNEQQWKLATGTEAKTQWVNRINGLNRNIEDLEAQITVEQDRLRAQDKAKETASTRKTGVAFCLLGIAGVVGGFGEWPMYVGFILLAFGALTVFGADNSTT